MANHQKFTSLREFYPFYLTEHQHPVSRWLHFIGTTGVFLVFFYALYSLVWWHFLLVPVVGYGFAWVGHAFFERNKPATFQYPFYSLASDFILYFHLWAGKQRFNPQKQGDA